MTARIDPELAGILEALADRAISVRLPFLVTLRPDARIHDVLPVTPNVVVELTHLAGCDLTAREALDLARDMRVVSVEFDGTAEALAAQLRHA